MEDPKDIVTPEVGLTKDASFTLKQTAAFLKDFLNQIESSADFSQFRRLELSYARSFAGSLVDYPDQAVATVAMVYPAHGPAMLGLLHPDASIIIGKRSPESQWGPNTWAVPMGTIDIEDANIPGWRDNVRWGDVIRETGRRELDEEISRDDVEGFSWVAGSFMDQKTGKLIHVVVEEIGSNSTGEDTLVVGLPDASEHTQAGWVKLSDFPKLTPVMDGTKLVLDTALREILKANQKSIASGHYRY